MKRVFKVLLVAVILIVGYYTYLYIKEKTTDYGHKVVVCIPVYGQSLALGEEAVRITDFEKLKKDYDGRILSENLDYDFGYFEYNPLKKFIKKLIRYQKRSFELSVYGMAELLAKELGKDTIICIFPGGQGATLLKDLGKGSTPYNNFLSDIQHAYEKAKKRKWDFYVPAICWMQGESDIVDYPNTDYKSLLKQFSTDINQDIIKMTRQDCPVHLICYQTNSLSLGERFDATQFECIEVAVPQALLELTRDDSLFCSSGPIYPYSYAREFVHIDGESQKKIGKIEAISALKIIRKQDSFYGLIPKEVVAIGNDIVISFMNNKTVLVFDTTNVRKADNYGFNVITETRKDIISSVSLEDSIVRISCVESPNGSKIRYAINGESMKSGNQNGPRGNLRDSNNNWCYQFETTIK